MTKRRNIAPVFGGSGHEGGLYSPRGPATSASTSRTLAAGSSATAREWTDDSGTYTVEAEFVDFADGKVRLKNAAGKIIGVVLVFRDITDRKEAEAIAGEFLKEQGIRLDEFEPPELRTRELQDRTDLFLRYRHREALLGPDYPYGVEVAFAGAHRRVDDARAVEHELCEPLV